MLPPGSFRRFLRWACAGSLQTCIQGSRRHPLLLACCATVGALARVAAAEPDVAALLATCDVAWDTPGPSSSQSMPIGNGDIGLNVWVEPDGDLGLYIGKSDAWGDEVIGSKGLMKVGGMHLHLEPNPLAAGSPFLQTLKLHDGELRISEGAEGAAVRLRVWVDANHPVVRIEVASDRPVSATVKLDSWRKNAQGAPADTILPAHDHTLAWYHRDGARADPHLAGLTFGAAITGADLVGQDAQTLRSAAPAANHLISIHPLAATVPSAEQWSAQLDRLVAANGALDLERTRAEHRAWWDRFWRRSWMFISGDQAASDATKGYVLQRFVTACAGRGAYPIKFNGSLFNVDMPPGKDGKTMDADSRDWGGQYWFQNTRPMYWPRLMAGDFDLMLPLFRMYAAMIPENSALVRKYYGHDGCYFAETAPFWGGLKYMGPEVPEIWTGHYFTPILELSMMMLDYYDYTGDRAFAKDTLIPVAAAGLTFFDQHFKRDEHGKLLLDPDNAIEMFWKVHDPAPDIAGLRAVLPRMIALPDDIVAPAQRTGWTKLLGEIPELPIGAKNRKRLLLPYTGPQTAKSHNGENPELYAIYPFRLFGLGKPDYPLALASFLGRRCKQKGCWVQDPIQAAMLGLSAVAKDYVVFNLTRKDPGLKFPAFWAHANDYQPDEDNGGNGENGLQQMAMLADGKRIVLLPAWPVEWDAEFKLNAPYRTVVRGRVQHGKLVELEVTPPERKADIVMASDIPRAAPPAAPTPSSTGSVTTILSAQDAIAALKLTGKGQPNTLVTDGRGEGVKSILDGDLGSKYFNGAQVADGANPAGVDTGFAVTPRAGARPVTAIQLATANDMPDRDPLSITIEGSNAPDAGRDGGNGFVLLYDGPTGLANDPGRKQWGPVIHFGNTTAYATYRVLVTEMRGDNADAAQYSEVRLGTWSGP